MYMPPRDETHAMLGLENSPDHKKRDSQLSGVAWDMTSRRTMEVKKSFGRPKLLKAQSSILGAKEFIFNNKSGLNMS